MSAPCPPLSQLPDKTIGTLVTEDANSSYDYASCQKRVDALGHLYDSIRQQILDFAQSNSFKTKEIKP